VTDARGRATVETTYRHEGTDLAEQNDAGRGRTSYAHDAAGRLTRAGGPRGTDRFDWDAAGNIVAWNNEELVHAPGNRLVRKGATELVHDAAGRLVEKRTPAGTTRYAWNAKGLLVRVEAGGLTVEHLYDPFSRRVRKRVQRDGEPIETTRFVWDGDVLVHEISETHGDTRTVRERTYCFQETNYAPIAERDRAVEPAEPAAAPPWLFHVVDRAGAADTLVTGDGLVAATLDRDVWGGLREDATATRVRFQGQYHDVETGLVYNRARWYDPHLARFISPDPLGLGGGTNAYAFVSDPLSQIDPLGTETWTDPLGYYSDKTNIRTAEMCDVPGLFTWGTHGTPDGMEFASMHYKDAALLAKKLLGLKTPGGPIYKKGMPIRLSACSTGQGGQSSIAAKLAKELGVPIHAPTGILYPRSGTIGVDPNTGRPGVWLTFTPQADGTVRITPTANASTWRPGCSFN
jgi:RHS repeat-associated protein